MTNTSTFAMGFGSPLLLGWLAAAVVPIVIHWLFRRRGRDRPWAAMQFLVEAARKNSRRTRLEKWLLLAARVLIVVLLVVAFAQPRGSDIRNAVAAKPPTLHLIVIDTSLSMGWKSSGQTLLDIAKQTARKISQRAAVGDRFALIRIAGSEPRIMIRQPTMSRDVLLGEVDRLALTHERGNVAATIAALEEIAQQRHSDEQCRITFLSDFQADNWQDVVDSQTSSRRERDGTHQNAINPESLETFALAHAVGFNELAKHAIWDFVELTDGDQGNATIVNIQVDSVFHTEGEPIVVTAIVRNNGSVSISERRITLSIDGQLSDSQSVSLPVGQEANVELRWARPVAGKHAIAVKLDDDALLGDNQRWLNIVVRSEMSVLLVNGRPIARPRDAATFFVEQALSPRLRRDELESLATRDPLRVTSVSEAEIPNLDLRPHDVIVLCDTGQLTDSDVARLRAFAQQGGGVVLSLGSSLSVERSNSLLFGTDGLMNVRLQEIVSASSDSDATTGFGFDSGDGLHPLLREFRGNPGAGLETALIRRYVKTSREPIPSSPIEVALSFSTGDPAILTQSQGRGRSVLVTTSLDESWGEWPVWAPGFVPLVHELVRYAAAGAGQSRELLISEPLMIPMQPHSLSADVLVSQPDGTSQRRTVEQQTESSALMIHDTLQPGIWTISIESSPAESFHVAVNFDPREATSERLTTTALSATRPSPVATEPPTSDAHDSIATRSTDDDPLRDSWAQRLFIGVLVLLLIEQGLAWKFSAGAITAIVTAIAASIWFLTNVGR